MFGDKRNLSEEIFGDLSEEIEEIGDKASSLSDCSHWDV